MHRGKDLHCTCYAHDAGALGDLLYPPLVRVAHRRGGLGQGRVILHGDEVGQRGEGGELPVVGELDAVVVLGEQDDGARLRGGGEGGAGRGRVHELGDEALLEQQHLDQSEMRTGVT